MEGVWAIEREQGGNYLWRRRNDEEGKDKGWWWGRYEKSMELKIDIY